MSCSEYNRSREKSVVLVGRVMNLLYIVCLWIWSFSTYAEYVILDVSVKDPTVFISILVRNKAHILPYFLTLLSRIDYPKDRITLWIRTDHNIDNSEEILHDWLLQEEKNYHRIDFDAKDNSEEYGISEWSELRLRHVIKLREYALNDSRHYWADYLWNLDSDVLITDASTLRHLISYNYTVTAPMLVSGTMYSNFWCGMTESYYYKRTDDYEKILYGEIEGCHKVPMVHSSVLINLNRVSSDNLTYALKWKYDVPFDDIIMFAVSAADAGIPLYVCNDKPYGYFTEPLAGNESLEVDKNRLRDIKLRAYDYGHPLTVDESLQKYAVSKEKTSFDLDGIFVINLLRRPERKERMAYILNELGIEFTFIEAVDGKRLQESDLEQMGVIPLPQYADPYHKRPIKKGEIGCFLSHMMIWKKVVDNGYKKVLVLEDDIRISGYFKSNLELILGELSNVTWDLVYLGRKILRGSEELPVEGKRFLVHAGYSYWTLAYLLSLEGARKLIEAKPLEKLVPVDEYLPIMYNKHPRSDWADFFPNRNLIALSANPLIAQPMKYLNEHGYVSDTEDSVTVSAADISSSKIKAVDIKIDIKNEL